MGKNPAKRGIFWNLPHEFLSFDKTEKKTTAFCGFLPLGNGRHPCNVRPTMTANGDGRRR
jgi:hypothetical protein